MFAARKIGNDNIVGYSYDSLVYEDLPLSPQWQKTYAEDFMAVRKRFFQKWVSRIPESATARNAVHHHVWIVPAPFRTIRYLNDARYLLDILRDLYMGVLPR